ncbi:hypothetical protein ACPWT1_19840 [Ramlibacter sp. MMS24-I3-19]|uniref:hypothetical protein n=1 Tax=Ramlibacter sp. MMS24-I3-19 TaxID=3416606 RepID=UPI003CFFAC28
MPVNSDVRQHLNAVSAYLRTDEREEAVRSIEWAALQAAQLKEDPYLWKWVLISLHNAVQGFLVLALCRGNGLLTLTPKSAERWMKAYESGEAFPPDRLDDFLSLYAKAKDQENFHMFGSGAFRPGLTHDRSMALLNEFRNMFTHFTPKGWSLELAGLPSICLDALDVVRWFGWETTAVTWYEPNFVERSKRSHEQLAASLSALSNGDAA